MAIEKIMLSPINRKRIRNGYEVDGVLEGYIFGEVESPDKLASKIRAQFTPALKFSHNHFYFFCSYLHLLPK
ncbi:unnamed protein product [Haemonchus placei]|uniref:Polyribonucleotide nucleotidyltransferase n=1 Tax=Haemonchus placei TaxID=6290 RepID=A0A0N4WBM0_HAEPC|nr:unnamed protein product [Haemonchus placei]